MSRTRHVCWIVALTLAVGGTAAAEGRRAFVPSGGLGGGGPARARAERGPRLEGPEALEAKRATGRVPFAKEKLLGGSHRRDFKFVGFGGPDRELKVVKEQLTANDGRHRAPRGATPIVVKRHIQLPVPKDQPLAADGKPARPKFRVVKETVGWSVVQGVESKGGARKPVGSHVLADAKRLGMLGKYVVIRDLFAPEVVNSRNVNREHLLGIPLTNDGKQPTHLHDVQPGKEQYLGATVRGVLEAAGRLHGKGQVNGWGADISLEGRVAVPILHVHGRPRSTRASVKIADWKGFLRQPSNNYQKLREGGGGSEAFEVYATAKGNQAPNNWPIVARATSSKLTPRNITAKQDALLGKMVLAVYKEAEKRKLRFGEIQVARDDKGLTVRVRAFELKPRAGRGERVAGGAVDARIQGLFARFRARGIER